jgi:hypothetical protein
MLLMILLASMNENISRFTQIKKKLMNNKFKKLKLPVRKSGQWNATVDE